MQKSWSAPSLTTLLKQAKFGSRICSSHYLSVDLQRRAIRDGDRYARPATVLWQHPRANVTARASCDHADLEAVRDAYEQTQDIGLLYVKRDGRYAPQEHTQGIPRGCHSSILALSRMQTSPGPSNFPELTLEEMVTLFEENATLREARRSLERDVAQLRVAVAASEDIARDNQMIQEMAVSAFERNHVLEAENSALRQTLGAFLAGSTTAIVQELRTIIGNLTREVASFKKRETDLQTRESQLKDKENVGILKAMRRRTKAVKGGVHEQKSDIKSNVLQNRNTG